MNEVKTQYYVPKSVRELEELFGKSVGVKVSSANSPRAMPYSGIVGEEYEFLQQARERRGEESVPTERIWGWRNPKDCIEFDSEGIRLCSQHKHIATYKINSEDYEKKLRMLKVLGLWEDKL